MNHKPISIVLIVVFVGLLVLLSPITIGAQENTPYLPAFPANAIGTAFTYQGRLTDGGLPANGNYNFRFFLWAEEAKTTLLGTYPESGSIAVDVVDGYFTEVLDFGVGIFTGEERWLEIEVNASLLAPLQSITPAPYAIYAQTSPWSGISGVPASLDDGDQDTTYNPGYGLGLDNTTFNVMTETIQTRVIEACGVGYAIRQVNSDGSVICETDDNTTYASGYGLDLVAGEFSVDPNEVQDRVDGACLAGQSIRVVNQDGSVVCEEDDLTTYTNGEGLELTGNVFSVDFVGSGTASSVARSDHNHWGQSWTGSGTGLTLSGGTTGLSASGSNNGVTGESASTTGHGVYGYASATSGFTYGVYGENESASGIGVYGNASATSGFTKGVEGRSWSPDGTGVYGYAKTLSGETNGVYGKSDSPYGRGVYGYASATSGLTSGVYGDNESTSGKGVYGNASATSGFTYGVYGENESTDGTGVYGYARAVSGTTYGVWGASLSADGTGVYGDASAASGFTKGVEGRSWSTDGTGVYGYAGAVSGTTYGVYGDSYSTSGRGVYGSAINTTGTTYGVYGYSASSSGRGVYGHTNHLTGSTIGVVGQSDSTSGRGVYGNASGAWGTTYGVYGFSASESGRGVYGHTNHVSGSTIGVVGQSDSTSGQGVKGSATADSGTTYGVVGYSASPDGYAGYFRNTTSGVGLYVQTDSGTGNIIEAASGFGELELRLERDGDLYIDGQFYNTGADYAEMLPGVNGLEPGEVLVIGPDGLLERSTQPYQTSVVGVYSTQPGFVAGAGEDGADISGQIPLAVMGVVPVKVTAENGPIQPGDLLSSSSTAGYAMRAGVDLEPGTIIGKALESWEMGSGMIMMLVMLR